MNTSHDPMSALDNSMAAPRRLNFGRQDFSEADRARFEADRANPNRIVIRPPVGAVEALLRSRSV